MLNSFPCKLEPIKFQRHDLVWLTQSILDDILPQWDLNIPFVVTRQSGLIPHNMLSIACSISVLKSSMSRRSFIIPLDSILKHSRPLLFKQVLSEFGLNHLRESLAQFAGYGVTVRLYGSMAWQYLTKRNYFTPSSDIDLLFEITEGCLNSHLEESNITDLAVHDGVDALNLATLHNLILHLQSLVSCTIDGELLFPSGNFVAWREWFNLDDDVLVKTMTKAMIMNKKAMLE